MILGISHIGITVPWIDQAVLFLKNLGFTPDFVEKDIGNPQEKKDFLHSFSETHTLAFLKGNLNSVGIELIQYPLSENKSENVFDPAFDIYIQSPLAGGQDLELSRNPSVGPIYIMKSQDKTFVRQLTLKSGNLEQSRGFWSDILGFRVMDISPQAITLLPGIPMPHWRLTLKIELTGEKTRHFHKLDVLGANLISLISSNLVSDRKNVLATGECALSPIFPLLVNQRNLKLCLGYSPEGQVLEFMEFS